VPKKRGGGGRPGPRSSRGGPPSGAPGRQGYVHVCFPLTNFKRPCHHVFRSARDAIRWLERELERGHKGIRAQERAEVGSLPWPAPPRRQEGRSRYEVREYTGIGYVVGSFAD
jgi:hypothetical protein